MTVRDLLLARAEQADDEEATSDRMRGGMYWSGDLGPADLEHFLDEQRDLSPKARPRYIRVVNDLPRTATHKVLHRELTAAGITDVTWTREERGTRYS